MDDERNDMMPSMGELSVFLSKYSAWLLGAGATCQRVHQNMTRIAEAYGKKIEVYIMPKHIHISLWEENSPENTISIATVTHNVISFNKNAQLSELSWEIADRKVSFREAEERLERITHNEYQNPWLVLLLVSFANASFCRLFGGDVEAMSIVWVATFVGYLIKILLLKRKMDIRGVAIICSFVSAIIGATGTFFSLGSTPDVALSTSVLYLVPGIPFLNSFSDMLSRHYLCALSRFTDAVVLTCCLSMGLCAGLLLMNINMFG